MTLKNPRPAQDHDYLGAVLVYNGESATAIDKGDAVTVTSRNGGRLTVQLAGPSSEPPYFYAKHLIPVGHEGLVVPWMLLDGINTSAATAAGDPVYLTTSGNWTLTQTERQIGIVVEDHATTGAIVLGQVTSGLLSTGVLVNDQFVVATITAAGGTGGATAGTFSIASTRSDESTAVAKAVQMLVVATDTQYAGFFDTNTNVTFNTASTGTLVASGSGWALIETDTSGAFACALANAADETVYFAAMAPIGYSDPTDHAQIISNSTSAVWSA